MYFYAKTGYNGHKISLIKKRKISQMGVVSYNKKAIYKFNF